MSEPTLREMVAEMRRIARIGVGEDDGHEYLVPAKDLAATSKALLCGAAALEDSERLRAGLALIVQRAEAISRHVGAEYEEDRGLDDRLMQFRDATLAVRP